MPGFTSHSVRQLSAGPAPARCGSSSPVKHPLLRGVSPRVAPSPSVSHGSGSVIRGFPGGGAYANGKSPPVAGRAVPQNESRGVLLLRGTRPYSRHLSHSAKRQGSPVTVGVLASQIVSVPYPRMQLKATLCWNQETLPLLALFDSGTDGNFFPELVSQAGIPMAETAQSPPRLVLRQGKQLESLLFIKMHAVCSSPHRGRYNSTRT